MRTDDLIEALAVRAAPVDAREGGRRFALKAGAGALTAFAAMVVFMGIRTDFWADAQSPVFWMKLLFPAASLGLAWVGLGRLGYPGGRLRSLPTLGAAMMALVAAAALLSLYAAPPSQRVGLVFGRTWTECSVNIAALSLPTLAFAIWALRGLAPTDLPRAGAAAGLFAGSAAAAAYALHCPEIEAPFVAVWYTIGMAIPAALGFWLGRRLLRW